MSCRSHKHQLELQRAWGKSMRQDPVWVAKDRKRCREYMAKRRKDAKFRRKAALAQRRYRKEHPDKVKAGRTAWYSKNRWHLLEDHRKYRESVKEKAFAILGKECRWKGCNETENLTFDHTLGKGHEHRQKIGIPTCSTERMLVDWFRRGCPEQGYYAIQPLCPLHHRIKTALEQSARKLGRSVPSVGRVLLQTGQITGKRSPLQQGGPGGCDSTGDVGVDSGPRPSLPDGGQGPVGLRQELGDSSHYQLSP